MKWKQAYREVEFAAMDFVVCETVKKSKLLLKLSINAIIYDESGCEDETNERIIARRAEQQFTVLLSEQMITILRSTFAI